MVADIENGPWPFAGREFAAVVVVNYLWRPLMPTLLASLAPGGVLFTYSCSGGISADLFHKIVASAGTDAGVDAFISERMGGAPDHPMTVTFPEGEYLKGLVLIKKS